MIDLLAVPLAAWGLGHVFGVVVFPPMMWLGAIIPRNTFTDTVFDYLVDWRPVRERSALNAHGSRVAAVTILPILAAVWFLRLSEVVRGTVGGEGRWIDLAGAILGGLVIVVMLRRWAHDQAQRRHPAPVEAGVDQLPAERRQEGNWLVWLVDVLLALGLVWSIVRGLALSR